MGVETGFNLKLETGSRYLALHTRTLCFLSQKDMARKTLLGLAVTTIREPSFLHSQPSPSLDARHTVGI